MRKRVSWDTSTEVFSEIGAPPKKKQKKADPILSTQEYQDFCDGIDEDLKRSSPEFLIAKLDYLRSQNELPAFLYDISFRVFDWSLEHRNVALAAYVIHHLPHRTAFVMINREDYASLKRFVRSNLSAVNPEASAEEDFLSILSIVLKIEPNWQIKEIIETCLLNVSGKAETIEKVRTHLFPEEKESEPVLLNTDNGIQPPFIFTTQTEVENKKSTHGPRIFDTQKSPSSSETESSFSEQREKAKAFTH